MNMRNYEKIEKSMWRNSKRCNGQLVSSSTLMCMITNIGVDINLFTCSFTLSFVWCVLFRASSVFLEWLRNEPVSYLNMHKALIFCKPLLCAILLSHHRRHESEYLRIYYFHGPMNPIILIK